MMLKLTGKSGRRRAGGGGVAQASHRIRSGRNKFKSWTNPSGVAFQSPRDEQTHGFDSNTSRVDERT